MSLYWTLYALLFSTPQLHSDLGNNTSHTHETNFAETPVTLAFFGGRKTDVINKVVLQYLCLQLNSNQWTFIEHLWRLGHCTPSRSIWILRGKKRAVLNPKRSISNALPSPHRGIFVFWNLIIPLNAFYSWPTGLTSPGKKKKKPGRCWCFRNEGLSSKDSRLLDRPYWNYFYKYLIRRKNNT